MEGNYASINGDPNESKIINELDSNSIIDSKLSSKRCGNEEATISNLPVNLVTVMGHSDKTASVYGNDLRNKNPIKMGNMFTFLFYKEQPLISIGPQYIYGVGLFISMNIINILLVYLAYPYLSSIIKIVGIIIFIMQNVSFIYSFLVNPGLLNRKYYISESVLQSIYTYLEYTNSESFDKYKICKICNIYVPPEFTVIHCEDCNICIKGNVYFIIFIIDMDHHCTFLGKCVGKKNIYAFNLFVLFTFCYLIFSMVCFIGYVFILIA